MSTPVGGAGGVRPLQPATPQSPSQQQVGNKDQAPQPQTPARAGPALNNINSFSSKAVSTDLEQLQQWLNSLHNKKGQTEQQTPQQSSDRVERSLPSQPAAPQTTLVDGSEAGVQAPPEPPQKLDSTQKKKLHAGVQKLSDKIGVEEADFARLAHARATGNDAYYFFQLGKMDIPPTSTKGRQLDAGLEKLFAAVKAPHAAIADQVSRLVVVDEVSRLARTVDIAPSLAVDLGALTHNEQDRFLELAQATGVSEENATRLLQSFGNLGEQFDIDAAELDEILGNASGAVNAALGKAMNQEASKLGLAPQLFNDLANAVLTRNTPKFIEIGTNAGLSRDNIKSLLPQVSRGIATIQAKPAFTGEKILRHTKDSMIQNQLERAGEDFGLDGEQTLQLTAALADGGLSGYVNQAEVFGLERNSQRLLNMFESIESQHGEGALSLATNNVDSVVTQRRAMKEFGLQQTPIEWQTSTQTPSEPGSEPSLRALGSIANIGSIFAGISGSVPDTTSGSTRANANTAQPARTPAQTQSEVRHVLLTDRVAEIDEQVQRMRSVMSPAFMFPGSRLSQRLDSLSRQREETVNQINTIASSGFEPSPGRVQEIRNAQEINELKGRLGRLESLAARNPLSAVLHRPLITILKVKIQSLEQQR